MIKRSVLGSPPIDHIRNGAAAARQRAGTTGYPTPAILTRARSLAAPELHTCVEQLHPDLGAIVGYHLGWCDARGNPITDGGGKGVCLALATLSAETITAPPLTAAPGAAAIELIHVFTHLHDDVMDHDEQRRNRTSAWKQFGPGPTVLAGDALYTEALRSVAGVSRHSSLTATRLLLDMCDQIGFGQAEDLRFEQLPLRGPGAVGVPQYLSMAAGKTGAVYAAGLAIGALLAGAPDPTTQRLVSAGRALGLVAQIVDDINGIWGDPAITGKPVGSDLRKRKKTLPIVAAVTAESVAGNRLAELLSRPPSSEDDLELLSSLVIDAGGLDVAVAQAERLHRAALRETGAVVMPESTRSELHELFEFIRHRHA